MPRSWRFPKILKRALKIFGLVTAIVMVLFGTATWVIFKNKNVWLMNQILSSVNDAQAGQLEIMAIDFKLFRNFPDVTIQLDSISYYEKKDSLRSPGELPILYAREVFVAMDLIPLVRGEVKVSEIDITKAKLSVVEYKDGQLNLDRAMAKPVGSVSVVVPKNVSPAPTEPTTAPKAKHAKPKTVARDESPADLQLDLKQIQLEDLLLTWQTFNSSKPAVLLVESLDAELLKEGNKISVKLTSKHQVKALRFNHTLLPPGGLVFDADLDYELDHQKVTVRESKVVYDAFTATLQGTYEHLNNRALNVQLDASSNDLALLSRLIKPKVIRNNPKMLREGDVYIKGKLFGELKNQPPQVDITFGVTNLALNMPKNLGSFENLGFEGQFISGTQANYSEAVLDIRRIRGQLPGGHLRGQFLLKNFVQPYVKYKLDAQLKLDGYDEIFQIDFLRNLTGAISAKANFDGPLNLIATHEMDSNRSSSILLDKVSFVVSKSNKLVSGLSGKIDTRNNTSTIQLLTLEYGKNDFLINATIDNLAHYLINRESSLMASGSLQCNQLFTADFILDTLRSAQVQDRITELSTDFQLRSLTPNGFAFDIRNLSAKFDELPDIKLLSARGTIGQTARGLVLGLEEFKATLPQGKVEVVGDLLVLEKRQLEFNAHLKLDKFPWTYVQELAAEIKDGQDPSTKNLPVSKMELITGDLDVTAAVRAYPFDINKLIIRNSRLLINQPNAKVLSVGKLNANLDHLSFIHPKNSGNLDGLESIAGTMELIDLQLPGLRAFDIQLDIAGKNDKMDIGFSSVTQVAKREEGRLLLDISQPERAYQLHYAVEKTGVESFVKKYHKGKLVEGDIDYTLDLRAKGNTWAVAKRNLTGDIEVSGDSLVLYGMDIDDALTKFQKSQKFNLTDLGAVLVAGPLGLVATKGNDFIVLANVGMDPSQQSSLNTLYSKWKLDQGVLTSQDVAFATRLNRIAIDGSIDFAHDSIPGLRVAVVDKNGCSLIDQRLYGTFSKPQTGKLNITKTLLGSVTNFVDALVGNDCTPVYTGRVLDPRPK